MKLRQDAGAVWIFLLVFLAGALNCAGFMRYGQTLSHMTGNLTRMGLSLAGKGGGAFWLLLCCVLCFFLGATVSGYGFPDHRAGLWRRCGLALMAGGSLIFLADLLRVPQGVGAAALAMALGAQNGLALRFRGILTRTTHMTGHLTDCGAALGRMVHARSWRGDNLRRFLFHLSCLASFFLGVAATALGAEWLERRFSADALLIAAGCYLLAGAGTFLRGMLAGRNGA
jgi:uncharacterized membrane protein YoaK (UPF0700 family)